MLHIFSHICCKCFICIYCVCLQWFSNVFRCFCKCFRRMFYVFHLSFCKLQVLHLDVSKVDQVLHMGCMWEAGGGTQHGSPAWARETQACAGDVRVVWDPCGCVKRGCGNKLRPRAFECERPSRRLGASNAVRQVTDSRCSTMFL
jgi:hypothetical protein